MSNKYQESLNYLKDNLIMKICVLYNDDGIPTYYCPDPSIDSFNNLQELIDNYVKQEELHFDEKQVYTDENYILKQRNAELEKALDKACNYLEDYHSEHDITIHYSMSSKEWKGWLLKNE